MAWTDPPDWTSAVLTSSQMDTYVTANLNFLKGITDGVTFSGCKALRLSAQSIPDATDTEVSFTSESFDFGGWVAPTTTDIIVPAGAIPSGYTTIVCNLAVRARFASNATGRRRAAILVNGSETGSSVSIDASSGSDTEVAFPEYTVLSAGDVVTLEVNQNSGGSLDLEVCALTVVRYAPAS